MGCAGWRLAVCVLAGCWIDGKKEKKWVGRQDNRMKRVDQLEPSIVEEQGLSRGGNGEFAVE